MSQLIPPGYVPDINGNLKSLEDRKITKDVIISYIKHYNTKFGLTDSKAMSMSKSIKRENLANILREGYNKYAFKQKAPQESKRTPPHVSIRKKESESEGETEPEEEREPGRRSRTREIKEESKEIPKRTVASRSKSVPPREKEGSKVTVSGGPLKLSGEQEPLKIRLPSGPAKAVIRPSEEVYPEGEPLRKITPEEGEEEGELSAKEEEGELSAKEEEGELSAKEEEVESPEKERTPSEVEEAPSEAPSEEEALSEGAPSEFPEEESVEEEELTPQEKRAAYFLLKAYKDSETVKESIDELLREHFDEEDIPEYFL